VLIDGKETRVADEKLPKAVEGQKRFYPLAYATPVHAAEGGGSQIVASHSLIPDALYSTLGVLMSPDLPPLPTSARDDRYPGVGHQSLCVLNRISRRVSASHNSRSGTDRRARAGLHDRSHTRQERVMLEYVVKLTRDATTIARDDHEQLRSVGFSDQAILEITLIASWFNYINRVADALGVGRE
jgi:alkylhydroperoxidase family enzyme